MKRLIIIVIPALLILHPMVNGNTGVDTFPHIKTLIPEAYGPGEFASFVPDDELLVVLRDDFLGKMRIVDSDGQEVPFMVRPRHAPEYAFREESILFHTRSLNMLPDNRIEIILEKDAENRAATPSIVELHTRAKNFEKTAEVYGSVSGQEWHPITTDAHIYDYSRFLEIRNTRINTPPITDPMIKIVIAEVSTEYESPLKTLVQESAEGKIIREFQQSQFDRTDFRIDRIQIFSEVYDVHAGKLMTMPYALHNLQNVIDPETGDTVITFDSHNPPLTAVNIHTDTTNFNRRIRIDVQRETGREPIWFCLFTGNLTRMSANSREQKVLQAEIRYAEPGSHFRIIIRNSDNPPLNITGITLEGKVLECLFYRDPKQNYSIHYGRNSVVPARYDIDSVLANRLELTPVHYRLSPGMANPEYHVPENPWPMEGKTVLSIVMVAMTLLLGGMIVAVLRKMEN